MWVSSAAINTLTAGRAGKRGSYLFLLLFAAHVVFWLMNGRRAGSKRSVCCEATVIWKEQPQMRISLRNQIEIVAQRGLNVGN